MNSANTDINSLKKSRPWLRGKGTIAKFAIVILLVLVFFVRAAPNYLSGHWSWFKPAKIENIKKLQKLRQTGMTLTDWSSSKHDVIQIGGQKWSMQLFEKGQERPVLLLLLPQNDQKKQPGVEWVDIEGYGKWKTDSKGSLNFAVEAGGATAKISADFFRARTDRQTLGVVQWYAWRTGGSSSPASWFMVEQGAQLQGKRAPWVGVSLQMTIDPNLELESVRSQAESLAKEVQANLMKDILTN